MYTFKDLTEKERQQPSDILDPSDEMSPWQPPADILDDIEGPSTP